MQLNQKNGEPNKNMSETSTSRKEVEVNCQIGEGHIYRKVSEMNSTLREDSLQGEKHTSINTTSCQKMEVTNKSGSITNETLISEEDNENSCQVGNLVNTVSAHTEGSHLMRMRITQGRSKMHPEKKPEKNNKDLDGDFIPKDVQTEYQAEEM